MLSFLGFSVQFSEAFRSGPKKTCGGFSNSSKLFLCGVDYLKVFHIGDEFFNKMEVDQMLPLSSFSVESTISRFFISEMNFSTKWRWIRRSLLVLSLWS